ncbi:MAG: TonB-dependent receptor [Saprospiraceae bacterium]
MVFSQVDLEKRMDYSARNLPLDKALNRLSKRSKISIAFSDNLISPYTRVSVKFKKKTVQYILEYLLRNTGLSFKVVGDQVVLFKVSNRRHTLSGYITDATSGERLIASHVFIKNGTKGTTTNEYGFYSLTLEEATVTIQFSYLGFKHMIKVINLDRDKRLDIGLEPLLFLEEVLVVDDDSTQLRTFSLEHITPQMINSIPALGGEPDLFRVVQSMPGIQTGTDGVGGIHVRGGNADQNLYLLDGVPIYNPSHLGGIFSIYDSDAIINTKLMKDFIPTRFGGRLSSVMDVRTKEGNNKRFKLNMGVGLTSAKASLEGPIKKDKGAFFISGRRSLFDVAVKPITKRLKEDRNVKGFSDYGFYDLNAKLNYQITKNGQLYLSAYTGKDEFYDESESALEDDGGGIGNVFRIEQKEKQNLDWGNKVAALRYNHLFNPKLFLNTTFTYSDYQFSSTRIGQELSIQTNMEGESDTITRQGFTKYESRIQDWALKLDFDYVAAPNHYWRFGTEVIFHNLYPGVKRSEELEEFPGFEQTAIDSFNIPKNASREISFYLEDQWTLFGKIKTNIGLRATAFQNDGKVYWRADPRIRIWYELNPNFRLKSSFSLLHQYLHLLSASTIGLPNDLWVSSNSVVAPQESWQNSLGFEAEGRRGLKISLDFYYKKMNRLVAYQEGADFSSIDARNWEEKVTVGEGESYGAELFVHRRFGKFTAWLSYSWSKTTRTFEELNLGRTFPFRYDRRHNGQINLIYNLNEKWRLSTNWTYGTGLATTLPVGKYEFPLADPTPVTATAYNEKNSFRMPAYHRMDFDISYRLSKSWGVQKFNFGIYNLYGRMNPVYYRVGRDPDDFTKNQFIQATLFQFLPYFSYRISIGSK